MSTDDERESRPVANRTATSSTAIKNESTIAREQWARCLITAAGGSVPSYGSDAWIALPEGDRRKVAAVVIAAECWATEPDDLSLWLRLEAESHKRTEDAEYLERARAHREQWRHLGRGKPGRYAGQVVRPLAQIGADAL